MKTEGITIDNEFGPLRYMPYANGALYDVETITVKPGFKVWVDGGVVDYDQYESICTAKSLDCSKTCCLQSYCAPKKSMCLHFIRMPYSEVYIGIFVVTMIVGGIPTCILTVEFALNFKFCSKYDEEADAMLGGMTICEGFTYLVTCGKSFEAIVILQDDYVYSFEITEDEI